MFVFVLACFASLQLAPWNTATTEVEMFAQGLFHRASHLHCLRFALSVLRSAKICG